MLLGALSNVLPNLQIEMFLLSNAETQGEPKREMLSVVMRGGNQSVDDWIDRPGFIQRWNAKNYESRECKLSVSSIEKADCCFV